MEGSLVGSVWYLGRNRGTEHDAGRGFSGFDRRSVGLHRNGSVARAALSFGRVFAGRNLVSSEVEPATGPKSTARDLARPLTAWRR